MLSLLSAWTGLAATIMAVVMLFRRSFFSPGWLAITVYTAILSLARGNSLMGITKRNHHRARCSAATFAVLCRTRPVGHRHRDCLCDLLSNHRVIGRRHQRIKKQTHLWLSMSAHRSESGAVKE